MRFNLLIAAIAAVGLTRDAPMEKPSSKKKLKKIAPKRFAYPNTKKIGTPAAKGHKKRSIEVRPSVILQPGHPHIIYQPQHVNPHFPGYVVPHIAPCVNGTAGTNGTVPVIHYPMYGPHPNASRKEKHRHHINPYKAEPATVVVNPFTKNYNKKNAGANVIYEPPKGGNAKAKGGKDDQDYKNWNKPEFKKGLKTKQDKLRWAYANKKCNKPKYTPAKKRECFKKNWQQFKPHRSNDLTAIRERVQRACWKYKNNINKHRECIQKQVKTYSKRLMAQVDNQALVEDQQQAADVMNDLNDENLTELVEEPQPTPTNGTKFQRTLESESESDDDSCGEILVGVEDQNEEEAEQQDIDQVEDDEEELSDEGEDADDDE